MKQSPSGRLGGHRGGFHPGEGWIQHPLRRPAHRTGASYCPRVEAGGGPRGLKCAKVGPPLFMAARGPVVPECPWSTASELATSEASSDGPSTGQGRGNQRLSYHTIHIHACHSLITSPHSSMLPKAANLDLSALARSTSMSAPHRLISARLSLCALSSRVYSEDSLGLPRGPLFSMNIKTESRAVSDTMLAVLRQRPESTEPAH